MSGPAFPISGLFSLNIKGCPDSVRLNIDADRPSDHGNGDVASVCSRLPLVVELAIDVHVLIIERVSQIVAVDLVNLIFELVANGLVAQDIVEHSMEDSLVILAGIRRVNPC